MMIFMKNDDRRCKSDIKPLWFSKIKIENGWSKINESLASELNSFFPWFYVRCMKGFSSIKIFENQRTNTRFSIVWSKIDDQKSGITPLVFENWGSRTEPFFHRFFYRQFLRIDDIGNRWKSMKKIRVQLSVFLCITDNGGQAIAKFWN